jgi:hypothetical protein
LNVGETPEWHPYDILKDMNDDEMDINSGVHTLLLEIRNFLDVLQSKLSLPTKINS